MKIDIFSHVMLPRYKKALYKHAPKFAVERAVQDKRIFLTDIEARSEIFEAFPDLVQVLCTTMPPLEEIVDVREATELARICNDEMAELVAGYPDRYVAAVANLPLNDMDAAMKEAERALKELRFRGIQIYSRVNGKSPACDEMVPLYELMVQWDLPIWIHPMRGSEQADYATEDMSYNQIFSIFGWPFDTTAAMVRLVFSGIFERFPGIKFITHHMGGMIPYFADRAKAHWDNGLERLGAAHFPGLTKHPVDYMRMFYADTALVGNSTQAMACGLGFFGEDHVLFGSDMPYDVAQGRISISGAINGIDDMGLPEFSKEKIYEGNARRLLHL